MCDKMDKIVLLSSGVTRGWAKWASRPPLESLGEILESRRKGGKGEGRGKRRGEGKRARKKGKWIIERKEEIVKGEEEKFVWGLPKWNFLPEKNKNKNISRWGKNRKCDFAASEKYSSYTMHCI